MTPAESYYQQGLTDTAKKDYESAISNLSRAIEINGTGSAYVARVDAYYDNKQYDKAVSDYSKAIQLDPDNRVIYEHRGDAYKWLRENQKARADLKKAERLGQAQ
jgi:tetratricopeptide (TPR) repeat protein